MPATTTSGGLSVDPGSVEGLFLAALAMDAAERGEFLRKACGEDGSRKKRVERLLNAYEQAGDFLEQAAGDLHHPPQVVNDIPSDLLRPTTKSGVLGMVGPYEVREFLGRGGMGIVARAHDPKLNRIVAVKVMAPELAARGAARQRFIREAQAAAAVSHPHVVTIHAVDEDKYPYLVMECIVGKSLEQKLAACGPLTLHEILRIGAQIADGLAAAHKQGLVHRDIKPANILLENSVERVKITDFGLARSVDDVSITRTGEISGTPAFMSPEQALGRRVDHRSDLFSLGCVLYAMCTGRSPFRGDSTLAVIQRVCEGTPRPIEDTNRQVPAWLSQCILRLLAKDPESRPQSAAEIATLLSSQLAALQAPAHARQTPASHPPLGSIPGDSAHRAAPHGAPLQDAAPHDEIPPDAARSYGASDASAYAGLSPPIKQRWLSPWMPLSLLRDSLIGIFFGSACVGLLTTQSTPAFASIISSVLLPFAAAVAWWIVVGFVHASRLGFQRLFFAALAFVVAVIGMTYGRAAAFSGQTSFGYAVLLSGPVAVTYMALRWRQHRRRTAAAATGQAVGRDAAPPRPKRSPLQLVFSGLALITVMGAVFFLLLMAGYIWLMRSMDAGPLHITEVVLQDVSIQPRLDIVIDQRWLSKQSSPLRICSVSVAGYVWVSDQPSANERRFSRYLDFNSPRDPQHAWTGNEAIVVNESLDQFADVVLSFTLNVGTYPITIVWEVDGVLYTQQLSHTAEHNLVNTLKLTAPKESEMTRKSIEQKPAETKTPGE
jgi:serine/threonine protein kinase